MKACSQFRFDHHLHQVEMNFDRELPILPTKAFATRPWPRDFVLDRSAPLRRVAAYFARRTQGRFAVESVCLRRALFDFLADLLFLPGLESIADFSRYSILASIGSCFDERLLAEQIARCVHSHFYSDECLAIVHEPNESKQAERILELGDN
jgi:hypothetical protein